LAKQSLNGIEIPAVIVFYTWRIQKQVPINLKDTTALKFIQPLEKFLI